MLHALICFKYLQVAWKIQDVRPVVWGRILARAALRWSPLAILVHLRLQVVLLGGPMRRHL